ncbi:MAG: MaoC family dehydratase [Rhodobacter sp.]|nr:MaoC family dehydratase [Rhodobacter sp.]
MSYSVDDLRGMVGQKVGTSRWFDMTQAMIDAHAQVVQDDQWIHTDPERAKASPFGTTVAHGFLTLGMLPAMAYDGCPEVAGSDMGVNYGLNRMRFLAPVPAGSRIRAHFTLNGVDERRPGEVTLTWGVEMEIEGQDRPALVAEWINRRYIGVAA